MSRSRQKALGRYFEAKYPGVCAWCNEGFEAGSKIVFLDEAEGKKRYLHGQCALVEHRTRDASGKAALPRASRQKRTPMTPGRGRHIGVCSICGARRTGHNLVDRSTSPHVREVVCVEHQSVLTP